MIMCGVFPHTFRNFTVLLKKKNKVVSVEFSLTKTFMDSLNIHVLEAYCFSRVYINSVVRGQRAVPVFWKFMADRQRREMRNKEV